MAKTPSIENMDANLVSDLRLKIETARDTDDINAFFEGAFAAIQLAIRFDDIPPAMKARGASARTYLLQAEQLLDDALQDKRFGDNIVTAYPLQSIPLIDILASAMPEQCALLAAYWGTQNFKDMIDTVDEYTRRELRNRLLIPFANIEQVVYTAMRPKEGSTTPDLALLAGWEKIIDILYALHPAEAARAIDVRLNPPKNAIQPKEENHLMVGILQAMAEEIKKKEETARQARAAAHEATQVKKAGDSALAADQATPDILIAGTDLAQRIIGNRDAINEFLRRFKGIPGAKLS